RTLVIPPFLAELLERHLESHDNELVFPALSGGPLLTTDVHTYSWSPVRGGAEARAGRYAREAMKPVEVFAGKRIHLVRHA
ncbi:hypothetical protein KBZ21_41905, partial [Streptomyces sp. A73]|nr:hypothetical protein [Streptomyces sp. A73]